jgi:osmotically-inducible protein OsmY
MAAGLRGGGRSMQADPAEMVGSYGESGSSHRGRGPKDYVRRDERIHEDVCERLTRDDVLDASDIAVRVEAGVVRLDGTVTASWAKRRAEDLAMVSGVRDVRNNLRTAGRRDA